MTFNEFLTNIVKFINPKLWLDKSIEIFYKIVSIPFRYWNRLPMWIHWLMLVLIILIAIACAVLLYKFKDRWKYVV